MSEDGRNNKAENTSEEIVADNIQGETTISYKQPLRNPREEKKKKKPLKKSMSKH